MGFSLSPSVDFAERDLTTSIPNVASSIGACVGNYSWGPVSEIRNIDREETLANIFGTPTDANYKDWFTAANFLSYAGSLKTVRVVGAGALNASNTGTGHLIQNQNDYELNKATIDAVGASIFAKYPGVYGNNITVDVRTAAGYGTTNVVLTGITGAFSVGETVTGGTSGATGVVDSIGAGEINLTGVTGTFAAGETVTGGTSGATGTISTIDWAYSNYFDYVPAGNEVQLVVFVNGTYAERHEASTDPAALDYKNDSFFVENVVARKSAYIWVSNGTTLTAGAYTLSGGADGVAPTDAEYRAGFDLFSDPETVDVNLIMQGGAPIATGQYIVQNIAEVRRDCVAFVSPAETDVVGVQDPVGSIVTLRTTGLYNFSSSYGVLDGNYKMQYDRYNDVYRWVPLNGDIAGLCARADYTDDPWFSPAGHNRGQIKSVVRLAFNPNKMQRDELYKNSINIVVQMAGEGTLLYGDKTMLTRPSAFSYINVRRLFIYIEKAIATASKYSLFELNDAFTRARFVQMVEPFLRRVKGRRGVIDYAVRCDENNNTGEVIDAGQFVADIFVKPPRSIQNVQLNFIATKSSVVFSEIIV